MTSLGKKKYEQKQNQEEDQLLKVGYIQNMNLNQSVSIDDSDIDEKDHNSMDTPMDEKLERLKRGTHKSQVAKRKRIKDIENCNDLWKWYWQHPIGHLPLIYYVLCLIFSLLFIIWWFVDGDTVYILCGMIGLIMSAYSSYKFKISIALKKEIDKYRSLNIKFRRENKKLQAEVKRVKQARKTLRKTKRRLTIANLNGRDNLKKFEQVEENMKVAGENAIKGMSSAYNLAIQIRKKWRDEFLANEREMLQAVYNRYERKHTNRSNLGMTASDFEQVTYLTHFEYMLSKIFYIIVSGDVTKKI